MAQEIASAIYADTIRDRFNIPVKNKAQRLFTETYQEYLKSLSNSTKTVKNKIIAFRHFTFKNKDITDITAQDIEYYRLQRRLEVTNRHKNSDKRESEINFRWINLEIATLRHFFNYCIKRGLIDKNPCSGIKKLNELSRLKTLSDEDIQKLIAGATNKLTRDIISFLVYTGCRKGEALNLKWDDVDLKNDVIAIKGTKTKYDRYIPISKPLKSILNGIEKNHGLYVFNDNGAKLGDFKRSFHTACRNAGLKDMRIHDLRHVFASALVMNDVSLYKVGSLLGHRTPNMTQRYAHLKPGSLKKEIEKSFGGKSSEVLKREEYERALEVIREFEKNKEK